MAEEAQKKVQSSIKAFVNDIDVASLRKMEKQMHECAARCCSNETGPIDEIHGCVEKCQVIRKFKARGLRVCTNWFLFQEPTFRAQRFVQSELERFQESLSRCVLQCQEEIKDQITPNTPDAEIAKFRGEFEACAVKCCDTNIAKLPTLSKKLKETLKSGKY